jgi:hypothetical protein
LTSFSSQISIENSILSLLGYKFQHQLPQYTYSNVIKECSLNHTTLALVAVLAAADLVIGAVASPAFAGGYEKRDKYDKKDKYGDSSKTVTIQVNKQKQKISGDGSLGIQNADNCIAVLNGANACRQQDGGA